MRLLKTMFAVCAVCGFTAAQAVSALAQTPPAKPPAQTTPPPAQTPPPATQTPAAPPAAAAAQPKPEAPRPFPEGAKIAYIDIQAVASNSTDGKAASTRIQELVKKKTAEIGEKNKQLEAARTKQQDRKSVV